MSNSSDNYKEPGNLRFLRILVTILTLSMIAGLVTVIVLIVIKFPSAITTVEDVVPLPDQIVLPDGTSAQAFTQGGDWYAVVTDTDEILIFNREDGSLRQTISIARP